MKPACWRAEAWLQRRAAGLSQAEGLRLEDHLAHCAGCRERASLLSGMRKLHASEGRPLSDGARRRVIERALRADAPPPQRSAQSVRLLWPALAVAAACTLASLAYLRSHPLQRSAPAAHDRVLAGELRRADRTSLAGALPDDTALETEHGARLALAHASVELRPATRVRWNAGRRTLQLEAGSVTVSVAPEPHRSFRVATARFDVLVLGTVFEVRLDRVSVQRGRVQVEPRNGAAPIVLEAAGRSTFQLTAPALPEQPGRAPADAATPDAAAPAHDSAPARELHPHARRSPSALAGDSRQAKPRDDAGGRASAAVQTLLDRARAELAARQVATARRSLSEAIAARPAPPQLAEALSLRAECDLVAGDYAAARAGYLSVAQRFSQLPAAESALFAAARIEAEHGDAARARALLERYLALYPHGSFAREVERRLGGAGGP